MYVSAVNGHKNIWELLNLKVGFNILFLKNAVESKYLPTAILCYMIKFENNYFLDLKLVCVHNQHYINFI